MTSSCCGPCGISSRFWQPLLEILTVTVPFYQHSVLHRKSMPLREVNTLPITIMDLRLTRRITADDVLDNIYTKLISGIQPSRQQY